MVGTVFKVSKSQLNLLKLRKKLRKGTATEKFVSMLRSSKETLERMHNVDGIRQKINSKNYQFQKRTESAKKKTGATGSAEKRKLRLAAEEYTQLA